MSKTVAVLSAMLWLGLTLVVALGLMGAGSVDWRAEAAAHRLVLDHPALLRATRDATYLGAPVVVDSGTLVAVVLLWIRRRRAAAGFVLAAQVVTRLVDSALKLAVARPRPVFTRPVAHASGFSFPSGHASGAVAVYLPLALVAATVVSTVGPRIVAVTTALAVSLLVAVTRVLLGVHYPSDVLAGLALGVTVTGAGWRIFAARTTIANRSNYTM